MNLVLLSEHYADFLLNNSFMNEYDEFHEKISSLFQDEGRYYSLLKEVFVTKELKKELAVKIKDFSRDESVQIGVRLKGCILLQYYLSRRNGSKILLADGKTSNIQLLKILLTHEGYAVCTTNTGEECISLAQSETPDLILLDALLPDMNGFDVAVKLKSDSATKDIPIIFLTAVNTPSDYIHAFNIGATDLLIKPFCKEELVLKITQALLVSKLMRLGLELPKDFYKDKKILLVDDVWSNVFLNKILFSNEGYNVCTANSGTTCIEVAQKEKPNIILLDVMMPDISGFDAAFIMKKDPVTFDIPILFLTALNTPADLVHGLQVGASGFLVKPSSKEELLMQVKKILAVDEMISRFLN
jgi:CheY-like chemotaxis protein